MSDPNLRAFMLPGDGVLQPSTPGEGGSPNNTPAAPPHPGSPAEGKDVRPLLPPGAPRTAEQAAALGLAHLDGLLRAPVAPLFHIRLILHDRTNRLDRVAAHYTTSAFEHIQAAVLFDLLGVPFVVRTYEERSPDGDQYYCVSCHGFRAEPPWAECDRCIEDRLLGVRGWSADLLLAEP